MHSDNIAIKVNHISKIYPLYNSTRDRLKEALHPLRKKYHKDFYALNDVSFEIKKGETVGIIGKNGSGKSTLLSIIAGVLTPTSGTVEVNGKISSLLELGTGFNPELTGIQNIYFYGTLLGFTKEEMDAKIDDILSFADIGDFVYQPVKTYSSGMYVRLAFAAAIAIDPEVLIVDEALSVGDEKFQRKCFSRIEVLKKKGVTILFVSHSASAVVELCDKAILFDEGELILEGIPKIIIGKYLRLLYAPSESRKIIRKEIQETIILNQDIIKDSSNPSLTSKQIPNENIDEFYDANLIPESTISYESKGAKIENPRIINNKGELVNCLISGRSYFYVYNVSFDIGVSDVGFGMLIKTVTGNELGGGTSSGKTESPIPYIAPDTKIQVEYYFECNLNPGVYFLNAGVSGKTDGDDKIKLHRILDAYMFRVLSNENTYSAGIIDFKCNPEIQIINL